MAPTREKEQFEWEKGSVLDEENTKPLGGVRARGIPKLKKAVFADPVLRKKERDQFILKEQSKSYREIAKEEKDNDQTLVIEESTSGLTGEYKDSAAKKLIDTGKKFKGIEKFKSPDKPKKDS